MTTLQRLKISKTARILGLITLVGGALRLIALNTFPPGLHFDEAVYGLLALDIYHGQWPVFFSAYTGREPLYMYVMAAVFRLAGIGITGIRLTSALIGIATLPLAFLTFRELYGKRRLALLTAALTAIAYWHLTVSRNGYPNILIPPLECLAILFLWRGYRDRRPRYLAAGGAFIGLVLYTYLAARLFPVTVALFFGYCFLVDRKRFFSRFWGIALAAAVSVLVFAPLGIHFSQHPHDFWERADQVLSFRAAGGMEMLKLTVSNVIQTLGGFFVTGDPRWHYNLPGKPIFDPLLAPFFILGIGVAVKQWRKPEYALLPIWVAGMCLPALLTADLMPQGQRMFGIIPAVFGLAALGLDTTLSWAETKLKPPAHRGLYVALAALLLFETGSTAYTYFTVWSQRVETYYIFDSEYVALAEAADRFIEAGDTVVIQSYHHKHPTVIFEAPRTVDEVWTSGGQSLVIPNRGAENIVYLRAADNPASAAIAAVESRLLEPVEVLTDPAGNAAVTISRLHAGVLQNEHAAPPQATFANAVGILDWSLPVEVDRNQRVEVLVHWQVIEGAETPGAAGGYTSRVHLLDPRGVLWEQGGTSGYLSEQWRAGDTVYELFEISLPPGIPAGDYEAHLVLNREGSGQLPVLSNGEPTGISLPLGTVTLTPQGGALHPLTETGIAFGDALRATSIDGLDATTAPGGHVNTGVTWQAQTGLTVDHEVTLQILDDQGQVQAAAVQPLAYDYPTSLWQPGEVVRVVYPLPLEELPSGNYRATLTIPGFAGSLALGEVRIEGGEQLFEIPPIPNPVEVRAGDAIRLLGSGFFAATYSPGDAAPVRLYWLAEADITGNYKVFVHVIGPDGQIWAQDDSVPAQWQRPTAGWAPGEIIVDDHEIHLPETLPEGEFTIFVGMYDAATLNRLPLTDKHGQTLAGDRLPVATFQMQR
ncbi:MAG: glycosyltransferase family 39 protein [Anaerolineae bacterium]|nr:glycosyltransferase family 39 protein [Anaerolineae bacterium]